MQNNKRAEPGRLVRGGLLLTVGSLLALLLVLFTPQRAYQEATPKADFLVAQEGTLEETVAAQSLVIRQERVVTTPVAGRLKPLVKEGRRVAEGTALATVTPPLPDQSMAKEYQVLAPLPGVVFFELDGLEGVLRPDNLGVLESQSLDRLAPAAGRGSSREPGWYEAGSPVARLVDNLEPVYLWLTLEPGAQTVAAVFPADGAPVWLRAPGGNGPEVTATVVHSGEHPLLRLALPFPEALKSRYLEVEVAIRRARGILLPATAVLERQGATGVMLLDRSARASWHPVEVLGQDGGQSVVRGLEPGQLVIRRPQGVAEGAAL